VVSFLEENHRGKYYIINVSNRNYDISLFEGRVKSYEWNDHQAPCLTTLFEITDFASKYLKRKIISNEVQ
jgi:phosphatidylinositol-3,4,5-trisphosphate 3-phosphatase/dual-specificity protein phosphatase PTEN